MKKCIQSFHVVPRTSNGQNYCRLSYHKQANTEFIYAKIKGWEKKQSSVSIIQARMGVATHLKVSFQKSFCC